MQIETPVEGGSGEGSPQQPGRILAFLFCAMVLLAGAMIVNIGWQGVATQHLVITSRSGGSFQPTVSTSTVYTGLAAVRVGLGMVAGGLLLASWSVAWAASVIKVWRRGAAAYQPNRLLSWLSLALLVLTFMLLLPPWLAVNAAVWIAVISALVLIGVQRRQGAASSIGRAIFITAVAFALVAPVPAWSVASGLLLFGGVFAHLFTLRCPRGASWTALAAKHALARS